MNIEFTLEIDYPKNKSEIIKIDIDENQPISELFSKLHDITKIERYVEMRWDGNVEKISLRYFYKYGPEVNDFRIIKDLEQKIKDFPKHGSNKELSLFMDNTSGLAN